MKILLSVFECNPMKGSDSYVGWSYVVNMAAHHEVYALTRAENRADIEAFLSQKQILNINNIHFIYVNRSNLFANTIYRASRYLGFLGSYFVWQKAAYREAKKLCRMENIDLCHHVSIADFRCAGYLWKCGTPFVFGPVGGGQETPKVLNPYIRGHEASERFRVIMNRLTTNLPNYRRALHHASIVYCSNEETMDCIKKKIRRMDRYKIQQMTELCIDASYLKDRKNLCKRKKDGEAVHIIVSGRLIYRKGVELLMDVLPRVQSQTPFIVDIYGDGDQLQFLKDLAQRNGIAQHVKFHGRVSFEEIQKRYMEADIYILPSLRETTGTSVFEAMANKLPVIALNQNGVKHIVENGAGVLVDMISLEQIQHDFALAIQNLIDNQELRIQLGNRAFEIMEENYTWTERVRMMDRLYRELCKGRETIGRSLH